MEVLEMRLRDRGTESEVGIKYRIPRYISWGQMQMFSKKQTDQIVLYKYGAFSAKETHCVI